MILQMQWWVASFPQVYTFSSVVLNKWVVTTCRWESTDSVSVYYENYVKYYWVHHLELLYTYTRNYIYSNVQMCMQRIISQENMTKSFHISHYLIFISVTLFAMEWFGCCNSIQTDTLNYSTETNATEWQFKGRTSLKVYKMNFREKLSFMARVSL